VVCVSTKDKTVIRQLFLILTLTILFTTLTNSPQAQDFWACPQGYEGQTVRVYNWTTYIAEDTISNFEALCGVTVIYDTFLDDGELVDVLRAGNEPGYDVVVPIDSTMYLLLAENLLQPLDFNNVPNLQNLGESFLDRARTFDPDLRYSVPYLWGTTGIGYNRTTLGYDITSFEDMFAADARVAWIDADRLMLGIALNILGLDPSSSNPADLEQAKNYLIEHSSNLAVIADDTGQDLLFEGQVDIVIEYSGDVFQIIDQCRCDDFVYVVPEEGTITDMTSLVVPVGAQNKVLGEIFIDYLLDKQVAADIANYTVYGSPNQLTIDEGLIYEDYLTDPAIYPPAEIIDKLFVAVANDTIDALFIATWADLHATLGK
jgi:spermidine/putrescine transport system substrate-binding protein